ncbi:MAG: hypothetical protein QOJ40_1241 [Verrucomicrobiota bacterium]|jgi:hypothetical protein
MKIPILASVAVASLLLGCGEKSSNTSATTNTSGSVVTAPVDYLKAITKGEQDAVKTVDTTSLNQAVDMFNVDKGRYPKDLNELVEAKVIPKLPATPYGTKLAYDPTTGKVSVVKE